MHSELVQSQLTLVEATPVALLANGHRDMASGHESQEAVVVLWVAAPKVRVAQLHHVLSFEPDLQESSTGVNYLWL